MGKPSAYRNKQQTDAAEHAAETSGNGLNFEATALGNTVHAMGGHAQGAPSPTITPLPPDATVSG